MADSLPSGDVPQRHQTTVRVLSVPESGGIVVRFLGPYAGCLTHFRGKRTIYCPGPGECPSSEHRLPTMWKGYAAVERWDPALRLWVPEVLEITECLEEDLRGQQLRGQVWLLARRQEKGEPPACFGTFCEQVNPDSLRAAFLVVPVLKRLWHRDEVKLNKANPLPERIKLDPVAGDAPHLPQVPDDAKASGLDPEDRKVAAEIIRKARERQFKPAAQAPEPSSNGKIPH